MCIVLEIKFSTCVRRTLVQIMAFCYHVYQKHSWPIAAVLMFCSNFRRLMKKTNGRRKMKRSKSASEQMLKHDLSVVYSDRTTRRTISVHLIVYNNNNTCYCILWYHRWLPVCSTHSIVHTMFINEMIYICGSYICLKK